MDQGFLGESLDKESVRLANVILTRLGDLEISLDVGAEQLVRAKLNLLTARSSWPDEESFTLHVNMNGIWQVSFSNLDLLSLRPEFSAWIEADAANKFSYLPKPLIRVVLERICQPIIDRLAEKTRFPILFVGEPRNIDRLSFKKNIQFSLEVLGEKPVKTIVRISWQDSPTLVPILELIEMLPMLPVEKFFPYKACIFGHLELGRMRLKIADVQKLAPGDVLLARLPKDALNIILGPNIALAASIEGRVVTLLGRVVKNMAGETTMSQSAGNVDQTQGASLDLDDVKSIELEISFQLPSIKLPVADCAKLTNGYTFTLDADPANLPIAVLAGGRKVAIGRLVDVGGEVGVQLVQVALAENMDGA